MLLLQQSDPDVHSDQDLYWLSFHLHFFDKFLCGKTFLFEFRGDFSKHFERPKIRPFKVMFKRGQTTTINLHLSRVMRKPAFCICKSKGADQLCGNCQL